MECTFLLGKPPPPKRKKARSEVEILEARLETIESAYSERLKQMEDLLNRVMPGVSAQELSSGIIPQPTGSASGSNTGPTSKTTPSKKLSGSSTKAVLSTAGTKRSSPSTMEPSERHVPNLERHRSTTGSESSPTPADAHTHIHPSQSPPTTVLKEEVFDKKIFIPQSGPSMGSPTSSIASSLKSSSEIDDENRNDVDPGGLAATMDKLRLFDASLYYGKGSIFFTSTDKNHFWDEEISFDVHDVHDIEIPPEATIMPPVEAIDMLFDIYYSYFHPFLPMIQKATLLRALEDRYEPQNIFLLNSVFMAVALTGDYSHPSTDVDPKDPKSAATPFFKRARMMLDYCIGVPRVSTVQGLLMLSRYPALGYSYLQQAMLMAADLGLHRKCDRWIPDKQVQETRKRVFWCVYAMDSITASITGRRPLIDDNEIDVPMLAPITGEGEVEYSNALFLIHVCVAQMLYESTLIMLHKPYLTSEAHVEHQHDRSRDICIKAASKITDMNRILNTTYIRTFDITGVPEYGIVNAVRIQVMYMNSEDPSIAEVNTHNFDYLMTFFLEYYSSPRANYDEQTINCILTFFDEFMHSVKGLSDSTVHMCECAIKNLALAKRARINLSRQYGGVVAERDPRNLSKLVRIGKEEHERELACRTSQEEDNTERAQESTHPTTTTAKSDTHVVHSGLEGYLHPGKFQKVSQYVGPFGGPEVMESLNIYQTSNAILNQPPTSNFFNAMNAFDSSFWNDIPASAFQTDAQILNQNIMEGSLGQQDSNMAMTQGGANAMPEGDNPMFGRPEFLQQDNPPSSNPQSNSLFQLNRASWQGMP
ncbi:Transcriptional activator of fatty acid utilization [Podila horticola]|nr:Transcriptional activator of fatty acid utilization [Podila horticola]